MRLLIVIPQLERAGAERVVANQAVLLRGRGHEVAVASGGGALEGELEAAGVRHFRVGPIRPTPVGMPFLASRIAAVVKETGAEVVVAHSLLWTMAALLGRRLRLHRCRSVAYMLHGLNQTWVHRAIPVLARDVDVILSVCELNRRRIVGAGFDPSRIRTLTNGVRIPPESTPEDRAAARRALGIAPGDGPVVGLVGRFVDIKGHDFFLRAAPAIRAEFPRTVVLVAGEGPLRAAIEAESKARVPGMLRFLGSIGDVGPVYRAMDLLVLPSWREALPMVLLEAGARRVPAVATRVGGVPEVIQPDVTGWIVPPRDAEALADAVIDALCDPERLAEAGAAARERVVARFSLEGVIDRLELELERLVVRAVAA